MTTGYRPPTPPKFPSFGELLEALADLVTLGLLAPANDSPAPAPLGCCEGVRYEDQGRDRVR